MEAAVSFMKFGVVDLALSGKACWSVVAANGPVPTVLKAPPSLLILEEAVIPAFGVVAAFMIERKRLVATGTGDATGITVEFWLATLEWELASVIAGASPIL